MKTACLLFTLTLVQPALAEDMQWVDDRIIQNAKKALVNVQVEASTSAFGFFVSEDGLIVTPASPLEDAKKVIITTSDNETISDCQLVAIDLEKDVAVLATGKTAPGHVVVSSKPAATGETCVLIFGFTPGQAAKALDGKLLARHEGLNQKKSAFVDYWIAARCPSRTGVLGGAVITRDGQLAGMCVMQELDERPAQQERVIIVPETSIAPLLRQAREGRKPLMFPQTDKTSDQGVAAVNPDACAGVQNFIAGDLRAAVEKYRAALRREPRNTVIMHGLAQGLLAASNFGKEETAEAKALLEKASSLAPENLKVRMLLGQVLGRMGENAKALQYLEDLTREFPKFAEAWAVLADTLRKEGRKAEVVEAMKKCTELEPESLNAWIFYSDSLAEAGNFDEASKARDHVHDLESLFFKLKYSAPHRK